MMGNELIKRMEYADNDRREREFVKEWQGKSKRAGDHYWFKANSWSGAGDYVPGLDDGEEPKGI